MTPALSNTCHQSNAKALETMNMAQFKWLVQGLDEHSQLVVQMCYSEKYNPTYANDQEPR